MGLRQPKGAHASFPAAKPGDNGVLATIASVKTEGRKA